LIFKKEFEKPINKIRTKFLSIKDEDMLLRFEELLKIAQVENKRELKPFTIEELNQRIDQSEKDFENGRYKKFRQNKVIR